MRGFKIPVHTFHRKVVKFKYRHYYRKESYILKKILWWGFVLVWVMVIFYFSSRPGYISRDQSLKIAERVEDVAAVIEYRFELDILARYNLHNIVRKNAHIFNYFILSIIIIFALNHTGVEGTKKYTYTWLIGNLIAILDELYQSFIPGRSGVVKDVLIDNIGIILGILLYFVIVNLKNYRHK